MAFTQEMKSMEERVVQKAQNQEADWSEEYLNQTPQEGEQERLPKFKLELGKDDLYKTEEIRFLDEGRKIENSYGKSILFHVEVKGIPMVWFVRRNLYSVLNTMAKQKPLTGKKAVVNRVGRTQKDTRWTIKFD